MCAEDIENVPAVVSMYVMLLDLASDAHPEVRSLACTVVDHVTALLFEAGALAARGSALASLDRAALVHRGVVHTRVGADEPVRAHSPTAPRISMSTLARTVMALKPKSTSSTPPLEGSFVLATPKEQDDYVPPYAPGVQGAPPSTSRADGLSTYAQLQRRLEAPATCLLYTSDAADE